ncbi:MAG: metallophosphoesterase family protein [Bryobacterales bacterium]|nr:metallophosphoesterase family protein [Bryobacterales bacterium]
MHLRVLALCSFSLLVGGGYLVSREKGTKLPESIEHQPSRIPDRIILTWNGEPSQTQAVTWRTSTEVTSPMAEIAVAEDGPEFRKRSKRIYASTQPLQSDLSKALYHSVSFTGLQADTQYVYRVGDGDNWSEWNQFRTASAKAAPLEFIYVGDAQTEVWQMWSRVIREGFSSAPRMRFIVHAGDLVNRGNRDAEWGEWHRAAGWINRSIPSFPTPGNHEYASRQENGVRLVSSHWAPQFTLPENGVPELVETNYYMDIQGVRMIALDSNRELEKQALWLDKLLDKNPNQWTVLTFHHPVYSTKKSRDNSELRELWQPILDKHKVDLVMTGHDHTYARTNLVTGTNVRRDQAGTVYVVSVSGPKMYELNRDERMQRAGEQLQLFQIIRIDKDRLVYESRTARGLLYDSFELRKRRGRGNELINRVPPTPEHRRSES